MGYIHLFYPTLIIKNHLPSIKNDTFRQYFLFLKADFTFQQIESSEKGRAMVGKFKQCWS